MSPRLCFVLLCVAITATVKGAPNPSASLWEKVGASSLLSTPARYPFEQHRQSVAGRNLSDEKPAEPAAPPKPKKESVKPAEPIVEPATPKKVHEAFLLDQKPKQQPKQVLQVKTARSATTPGSTPNVPMFAKLILGDPAHPKLATVESLRKVNWRSVQTSLELPNKETMPMVEELLQKTEELLRLFQDIQFESNGFVEDIQAHNDNALKEYIGYYN